jgi:hypothetical protein
LGCLPGAELFFLKKTELQLRAQSGLGIGAWIVLIGGGRYGVGLCLRIDSGGASPPIIACD